ncbi:MAG: ferrous iron transport protein A [Proteobacteria bacterium]|nr:ferrous iron transport protein A [Pseudomonadota bacterium]
MTVSEKKNTQGTSRRMLRDIEPGRQARIRCHHANGAVRQRLLDLGFVPRTIVKVIRKAPLGDPIECSVGTYKVALRNSEASLIEVEPD